MKGGTRPADVVPHLRALHVPRQLTQDEERAIAERQADMLLGLHGVVRPPVPVEIITSLPGLQVEYDERAPVSGLAVHLKPHHWRVIIAAHEPHVRRRFSLAHEFKHVLDDPMVALVHAHLSGEVRQKHAERICNYFAACVLMPATWIKRDWVAERRRGIRELASRYGVSTQAMGTRLYELGLRYEAVEVQDGQRGADDE